MFTGENWEVGDITDFLKNAGFSYISQRDIPSAKLSRRSEIVWNCRFTFTKQNHKDCSLILWIRENPKDCSFFSEVGEHGEHLSSGIVWNQQKNWKFSQHQRLSKDEKIGLSYKTPKKQTKQNRMAYFEEIQTHRRKLRKKKWGKKKTLSKRPRRNKHTNKQQTWDKKTKNRELIMA